MTWLTALLIVANSPYVLRRRHEWRWPPKVDRGGLWPLVTIGWWTWDALGLEMGKRLTDLADELRGDSK